MSDTEKPTMDDFLAFAAASANSLKLRPTEARLIRNCIWARSQVENGYFLTPPRTVPSALRLIERGYLTKAKDQMIPAMGLVVVFEQENWAKLITDAVMTDGGARPGN